MHQLRKGAGVQAPARDDGPGHAPEVAVEIDQGGSIREAAGDLEQLFGYTADEVVGQPIAFLLPELERIPPFRGHDTNPRLSFLCHCGKTFHAVGRDGLAFDAELFCNRVESQGGDLLSILIRWTDSRHPLGDPAYGGPERRSVPRLVHSR
jgi:PAS domain S-box-containing protein